MNPIPAATQPMTVAIVGAGLLGRRLALASARAGYRVFVEDVMPMDLKHAQEELRQQLGAEMAEAHIVFLTTLDDAVREADLVIDCVPDELESKLEILLLLDRMAPPRAVLATPTLNLSIEDLASCTYRPDRCIAIGVAPTELAREHGAIIPLCRAPQNSDETVNLVKGFWQSLGSQVTIEVAPKLL